VPLALPAIEFPDGYPSHGEDLPDWLDEELQRDQWIGHALRPRKISPEATAAVVGLLNQEPHRSRLGRPVRLLVSDLDHPNLVAAGRRLWNDDRIAAAAVPVTWLHNAALTAVMRRSHFGLLYDWFPEPFGLYPLESVFHRNPVYTSGTGNLRHLLPPDHGIRVIEPSAEGGPIERHAAVARAIAGGLVSGRDAAACERGRAFIAERYNAAEFRRGLGDLLEQIERAPDLPPLDPEATALDLSPMVRSIHAEAGLVCSDLGELRLPPAQIDLLRRLPGTSLRAALRDLTAAELADVRSLFSAGAVTLGSAAPAVTRVRLPPASG
jgi:hypothetical protein